MGMTAPRAPNWAIEDVAHAELGDRRRRARASSLLGELASRACGTITRSFRNSARREAAYRFVESRFIRADLLLRSVAIACLLRIETSFFIVALDFCYLTFLSASAKATGPIGTQKQSHSPGLVSFNGLALTPQGTPLGLCFQTLFARSARRRSGACPKCKKRWKSKPKGRRRRAACSHLVEARLALPLAQKETRFWIEAMNFVLLLLKERSLSARPWFQCDRGADFWELLQWGSERSAEAWVTVRCNSNRKLEEGQRVREFLKRRGVLYRTEVEVPEGPRRKARTAKISVRACRVTPTYRRKGGKALLGVVWVREVGAVPVGEERLDWVLWTTHPVKTVRQVKEVVEAYEKRWCIEEFHKTWKSVCGVEKSQLRSPNGLKVWATLLAMAAARIQRMLKRAREEPKAEASSELSETELEALLVLNSEKGGKKKRAGSPPTLGEAVTWIAELGGYTGKSSGGPPGAITLARGLADLRIAVATIALLRSRDLLKM